jgi:hypothetical protein
MIGDSSVSRYRPGAAFSLEISSDFSARSSTAVSGLPRGRKIAGRLKPLYDCADYTKKESKAENIGGRREDSRMFIGVFHPATAATQPPERILSFDSRIEVNPDAGMLVTETIKVLSTGEQIRRGIFRDFPTTYKDRTGNHYMVGFTVQEIMRDGKPEAWHTENLSNGVRVYMGRKEHLLPSGEHTYTLTYRTDRQLGFFKDHDEFYWKVTGNGAGVRV